jgi:hypothetical protein
VSLYKMDRTGEVTNRNRACLVTHTDLSEDASGGGKSVVARKMKLAHMGIGRFGRKFELWLTSRSKKDSETCDSELRLKGERVVQSCPKGKTTAARCRSSGTRTSLRPKSTRGKCIARTFLTRLKLGIRKSVCARVGTNGANGKSRL